LNASDLLNLSPSEIVDTLRLFAGMRSQVPIRNYVRVMQSNYARTNPLGYGSGPSRFSPVSSQPPTPPAFGLIYGTVDLATACYEAIIRHRLDLSPDRILHPADYDTRSAINFSTAAGENVNLLDLTNGNAIRYGVPTDVIRYSNHTDGQYFSAFVYNNMREIDGILYNSRLTGNLCVAIYGRAIAKLVPGPAPLPLSRANLTLTLSPWNIDVL
jgi:hypothetical protein